jgi:hypothetical protein
MDALKAHQRLLESDLPRTTHLSADLPTKRGRTGASLPAVPIKWGKREFKSLSHASKALGIARQTIKRKLGIK